MLVAQYEGSIFGGTPVEKTYNISEGGARQTFHPLTRVTLCAGYGFVDFDRFESAQKAVLQLKQNGVQAQMAKVST